ncbi:ATP-binding protein [Micromonospora endolithica]|uniref:ATP-binding protein n=1 Tax=Micromonospora endolithica TaxID=230091 RepID=A0A3A9YRT4_9ACTN|nr:ATP-binding protein [Micromonospora endolithica]RKN38690.1 ATP-binding protein [Micromonospora endolithica]TWJ25307.1 CO dehydrogenase maturation factor [Micromonospora endolithica]
MKVAFVGKGGSGKTTLAALYARHLVAGDRPVLAIDADINQHLAAALGGSAHGATTLGEHLPAIKEYLRGDNPRIGSAGEMVKTTPPGTGSRLLRVSEDNPVYATCVRRVAGVPLAVTGEFTTEDLGVACYHSKVGAVELMLNHLLDGPGEYVVVDMTAGADAFASGLFTRFDRTFLVCEPTVRSVGVYRQYAGYARDYGVALSVVGNKVEDAADVTFLREHVGADLLTWMSRSAYVRRAERGTVGPLAELEAANRAVLEQLTDAVDGTGQDWTAFTHWAHEFHRRNAAAWANDRTGVDLTTQIDPDFRMGPQALSLPGGVAA